MTSTSPPSPAVDLASIRDAARRIDGQVERTPCLHSRTLSAIVGAEVWIKFENLQFTASFKERGALNRLTMLDAAGRAGGVIAASAGNHAQGLAYHAQRLGIPAVIVMPRHSPAVKIERTEGFGAEVVLFGDNFDQAREHAHRLAQERALTIVHPYDDPAVIAGQGTVGLELFEQMPAPDVVLVAVGGGGLISGIACVARDLSPQTAVVGVQSARYPGMYNRFHQASHPEQRGTIAEGIAVLEPGALNIEMTRRLVDDVLLVDEDRIEQAILLLLEVEKTVAEGAGAAGLAGLLANRDRFAGKRVATVLCGGNIDPILLTGILGRGMVRSGRLARIRIELRDVPGALADLTTRLADLQANIEEVHHQRTFSTMPLQNAEVDVVIQTRGKAHVAQVLASLSQAGYQARGIQAGR
ncbi:MAG: threonine ammonia-lyase [Lautropia sp.]